MKKRWIGWLVSICLSCTVLSGCQVTEESEKPALNDDYYASINYETFQEKSILETEGAWSWGYDMHENVVGQLQQTVKSFQTNGETYKSGSSEQKIKDLYACALDLEDRNEQGLLAIQPFLDQIDRMETMEDCSNVLITLADNGFQSAICFDYEQDDMDSSQMAVYFESADDLIGKAYLDDQNMAEECDAYQEYMAQMLVLSGETEEEAQEHARAVLAMISQIAAKGISDSDLYNPEVYYNPYTYDELLTLYSGMDMAKFLEKRGLSASDRYIVMEENAIRKLNTFFVAENIPVLKEYIKFELLKEVALYGPVAYRDLSLEMERKLSGAVQQQSDERLAYDEVASLLEWDLGKIYVKNSFDETEKNDVENMIAKIITEYKAIINSQDWMSDQTKAKAILKLDTMSVKVAYPDEWPSICEALNVTALSEGGSNLSNIVAIRSASQANQDSEFHKGVNRQLWYLPPQTVEAYYDPANNGIVFPAAILQAPFYDSDQSDGTNMGGIGTIIGHEISHAFDKNGSLYNEKGNYEIWWTDEEYQKYDELSQSIVEYYSRYTIDTGSHVNGELTLGENIADLGGMTVVNQVANKEGYDLDEVYTSFAIIWAGLMTDELAEQNLLMNVHSPNKVRVNGVLSSMNDFYTLYNIGAGEGMYVAPEERVGIWQISE